MQRNKVFFHGTHKKKRPPLAQRRWGKKKTRRGHHWLNEWLGLGLGEREERESRREWSILTLLAGSQDSLVEHVRRVVRESWRGALGHSTTLAEHNWPAGHARDGCPASCWIDGARPADIGRVKISDNKRRAAGHNTLTSDDIFGVTHTQCFLSTRPPTSLRYLYAQESLSHSGTATAAPAPT